MASREIRMYASEASVVIEARVVPNTTPVAPDVTTEKQIVTSGVVIEVAARSANVTEGELSSRLNVTVPPDTKILSIVYRDADPGVARRRVRAVTNAYLEFRNGAGLDSKIKTTNGSSVRARLLTPATLPREPDGYHPGVIIGLGVVIGLVLGLSTALLRDLLSDRLRSRADFEKQARAMVLAEIPLARGRLRRAHPVNVAGGDRESPTGEAFRYLRVRLSALKSHREGGTVILVTSAQPGEGRTSIVSNLAVSMAASGASVIAVDGDLRSPSLHLAFGTERNVGLSTVLMGEVTPVHALRTTLMGNLRTMSAGWSDERVGDLMASDALRSVMDELRARADFVIVDSSPVLGASDAVALAGASDVVLLVADAGITTRKATATARREFEAIDTGLFVGVLNRGPHRFWRLWGRAIRFRKAAPAMSPLVPSGPGSRPAPVTAPLEVVTVARPGAAAGGHGGLASPDWPRPPQSPKQRKAGGA
jgi:capsular exopolysaccharide synthesis family protein